MRETHSITVEKVLPYSAEKIWRTLTSCERIAKWLMPNDFAPAVGHRFNFRTSPMGDWDGVVHCEVLACNPPKLLRYSWKGGADSNPAYGSRLDTTVTWTLTPAEMDFLNSSRMTRDEILAVFRVPPPITGIVENMGLGADIWFGARVMFCEGTIQPKLALIAQALTRDLGRRYGPDVTISFPPCSPRNQDQRRKDDALDTRMGLRTYNEIRRSRGLQPYPDARFDKPILPPNLTTEPPPPALPRP